MFYGKQAFYFATTRKLSIAFGTLFNNLYIQRFDEVGGTGNVIRTIRVPLSYAAGEKWYTHRITDIPAQEKVQTKISLPRIGFELVGMQYDPNRKLQTVNGCAVVKPGSATQFLEQLNPVPYDFQFDVQIAAKNIDDGLQIIEQILPAFQPSYNLRVDMIPELQITRDVPVLFGGITFTDTYEGSYEESRVLIWTLSFVVKAFIYPAITDANTIKKVFANLYTQEDMIQKDGVIGVRVDPLSAAFDDEWTAKVNNWDTWQLDSNGNPIMDSNCDPLVDSNGVPI